MKLPIKNFGIFLIVFVTSLIVLSSTVLSLGSPGLETIPDPNTPQGASTLTGEWVYDPMITELGKSAERARQLIFWVFSHPAVYNASVLFQMWTFSRNIAYVFVVVTIVILAVHLVMSNRSIGPTFSGVSFGYDIHLNVTTIVGRIAGILIFLTFSYILVLGLIQGSSIMMQFFVERVGGCDLFNIKFAGGGSRCVWPSDPNYQDLVLSMEKNYTEFKGYHFETPDQSNLESINTSILLIRITSLTYNAISTILILRYVILWFFLILSPFLGLLLPFIFIRNVGWIWIGEFFRWLFYGPMVALFIAGIARVWKAGIPFSFDFSRIDTQIGQIYPTSISILYGGPAQTLSPTNSANYVDTYAEYVISLVMLWAAIIVPWLLLRIFRDYCCDILKENKAVLMQLMNQIKQSPFGMPPTKRPEKQPSFSLPFRNFSVPFMKNGSELRTQIVKQISEKDSRAIPTDTLARAFNLHIATVADVARAELKHDPENNPHAALLSLTAPIREQTSEKVQQYELIKQELTKRAREGDTKAQRILHASDSVVKPEMRQNLMVNTNPDILKEIVTRTEQHDKGDNTLVSFKEISHDSEKVQSIVEKTTLSEKNVREILTHIPTQSARTPENVLHIATKISISPAKVNEVLTKAVLLATKQPTMLHPATTISIEDYEEAKEMWRNHYSNADVPFSETIKTRQDWLEEDIHRLRNVLELLTSHSLLEREKGVKTVQELLPFLLLGGFSDSEMVAYLTAKLHAAQQVKAETKNTEEPPQELVSVPVIEKPKEKEKILESTLEIPENIQELSSHWDDDKTSS